MGRCLCVIGIPRTFRLFARRRCQSLLCVTPISLSSSSKLSMATATSMAAALAASLPAPAAAPAPTAPTHEAIPASMAKVVDIEADIPLTSVQLDGMVRPRPRLWYMSSPDAFVVADPALAMSPRTFRGRPGQEGCDLQSALSPRLQCRHPAQSCCFMHLAIIGLDQTHA